MDISQENTVAIEMQPVRSSNIASLGFDAPTTTLAVQFTNGSAYRYTGVPQEVFTALLTATSVGAAFGATVRGKYPGVRVDKKPEPTQAPALNPQAAWPFPTHGR